MNRIKTILSLLAIGAAVFLLNGCATNRDTEDLLAKAGFKMVPATTEAQQAHLKTLPAHKISQVKRDGKMYFVYPDAGRNVLYIGLADQYLKYQKLVDERNLQEQQLNEREINEDTGWSAWGPTIAFP